MGLNQSLHLRQSQRLVMTPMLQQALKILQLNGLELAEMVQSELNENPMLEEVPEEGALDNAKESEGDRPEKSTEEVEPGDHGVQDDQWEDYFEENGTDYVGTYEHPTEQKDGFENFLSVPLGLQEHLLRQLDALELDEEVRRYAEEVVGWIDERGYLSDALEKISTETNISEGALFEALRVIQGLEPTGVGSRNLRECLLLQLEAQGLKGSLEWKLCSNYLEELAKGRDDKLAKALNLDKKTLSKVRALIAALEPTPGRPFGGEANPSIAVDASVVKNAKGEWEISLKDDYIPRLGISRYYKKMMKQAQGSDREETRNYLNDKYQSALWLMRGIEQRKRTLRRVLENIVEVQAGFLDHGPSAFKPLALKDVATVINMHESTVSRVTTNKYVQTPRGVYELKYFFSGGLKTSSGENESAISVKEKIKDLLSSENELHPLSDQAISDRLQQDGVRIARRTVAKYREELKILPAHQRRRRNKAGRS